MSAVEPSLEQLEQMFVRLLPEVIAKHPPPERVWCLAMRYFGGADNAPLFIPEMRFGADRDRCAVLTAHSRGTGGLFEFDRHRHGVDDSPFLGTSYCELADTVASELEDHSSPTFSPERAVHGWYERVARRLNLEQWDRTIQTTDNFFVFAYDLDFPTETDAALINVVPQDVQSWLRPFGVR